MPPKQSRNNHSDRARELEHLISRANRAYFSSEEGARLSDDAYDTMVEELSALAPGHPLLQRVGHAPPLTTAAGTKVTLPFPMGSLDKIKYGDVKRLRVWKERNGAGPFAVSDKLDGVSALLMQRYGDRKGEHGSEMALYTRGDGNVGQDVSRILPLLKGGGVASPPRGTRAVRGELVISKHDFARHLKGAAANARNAVSGAVNARTLRPEVLRCVQFVAYEVLDPPDLNVGEQLGLLLEGGGARCVHFVLGVRDEELNMDRLLEHLEQRRVHGDFEVDGLVLAPQNSSRRHHAMSSAVAFKSRADANLSSARVRHVEWGVSKDGMLKPVVVFEQPVLLGGARICRATGFHAGFVRDNRVGPGAKVLVTRSGDVIPHIVEVTSPAVAGHAQLPSPEEVGSTEWSASGKDMRLVQEGDDGVNINSELGVRRLAHFAQHLGVAGLRDSTAAKLWEAGVRTPGQLVRASEMTLASAPGIGRSQAASLRAELDVALERATCLVVMRASNAFGQGFGERKLRLMLAYLPELWERLSHAGVDRNPPEMPSAEDLAARVPGVALPTAKAFLQGWQAFERFQQNNGIPCHGSAVREHRHDRQGPLSEQAYVFTGFRDRGLQQQIEDLGGRVTDSVSPRSTAVVVAREDEQRKGTKVQRAADLGVPVLTKDALVQRIKGARAR